VRRKMVEQDHPHLSITQQCDLLSISRSSFYYEPKGETAMNCAFRGHPASDSDLIRPPIPI